MTSKASSNKDSRKRLYGERTNITPTEKRVNSSTNQKYKSGKRILNNDQKNSLSKQDLINQHTELLERLQNMKAQLEYAQEENKKLCKELRKLKSQNSVQNNSTASHHKASRAHYHDHADNYYYSDHDYEDDDNNNYGNYDDNDPGYQNYDYDPEYPSDEM